MAAKAALPGGTSMNKMGWAGTFTGFAGLALLTSRSIRGQSLTSANALVAKSTAEATQLIPQHDMTLRMEH
jgi:hypothetical protein